jgi:hypothetical protein
MSARLFRSLFFKLHLEIDCPLGPSGSTFVSSALFLDDGQHSIQNDICCCGQRILLKVIPFDLATTDRKGIDGSSAIKLWIWWVSNPFNESNKPPANRHVKNGHHSIQNDIWCCGQRILLKVIPFDLATTDRKGIDGSSGAIKLRIGWDSNPFTASNKATCQLPCQEWTPLDPK